MIHVDEKELLEFIADNSSISIEDIVKVLDLEIEFLALKGVIEELPEEE